MASANGHLTIMKIILDKDCDVNARNDAGNTALRKNFA